MEETCLSKIALTKPHQKGEGCPVLALYGDVRAKPMFLMPFLLLEEPNISSSTRDQAHESPPMF